jgi:hypothetical protein
MASGSNRKPAGDAPDCSALAIAGREEVFGLAIPMADRISALADRYREILYRDLRD